MTADTAKQSASERPTYSIADLAREFGVSPRTLRHYEDRRLLLPKREGQNRIYSAGDRAKISWILRGKRVGFSLADIAEMLDLYDLGDGRKKQRQVTAKMCEDRIEALQSQRDDLDLMISEMTDFVTLLKDLEVCKDTGKWTNIFTGEQLPDDQTASLARLSTLSTKQTTPSKEV